MLKVVCSSSQTSYSRWIDNCDILDESDIEEADLLILTGGADIEPRLYGQKAISETYFSRERDEREIFLYKKAIGNNIPIFGICRGLQLLGALNGCQLFQDVTNHAGRNHETLFKDSANGHIQIVSNSLHHQMVNPFVPTAENVEIIGFNPERYSRHYLTDRGDVFDELPNEFVEVEALYFPKINAYGIQGHPEMSNNDVFVNYNKQILKKLLLNAELLKKSKKCCLEKN